jgi:hypothetical protein
MLLIRSVRLAVSRVAAQLLTGAGGFRLMPYEKAEICLSAVSRLGETNEIGYGALVAAGYRG